MEKERTAQAPEIFGRVQGRDGALVQSSGESIGKMALELRDRRDGAEAVGGAGRNRSWTSPSGGVETQRTRRAGGVAAREPACAD
jgi:hypothetical protein